MKKLILCIIAWSCFLYVKSQCSDNGDGTFSNPVLFSDFPDPDAIRVGDTYYMVSTSMHYFPGVTILSSKDLVNWEIASNAVEELKIHPYYDMDGGTRYAKGQWATSIRYFNDKFYVLFNTLDEGAFICYAHSANGPWTIHKIPDVFLYDPGLFVDDDGRVYVIHGNTEIFLTELTDDALSVKKSQRRIYTAHKNGLEGNHCYKINGYYYIFCTYGSAQGNQVCLRSKSLDGPFEEKVVMDDDANLANMILHQGCLLDMPSGEYWSLIFQDRVGLGRIPFLVPVRWEDGWPLLGDENNGNITFSKPIQGYNKLKFPTTDEFSSSKLGLQWQFNHNPDTTKYSLAERVGHLRLCTAAVTDSLMKARNTICQRIFGPRSIATAAFDLEGMKNGDKTGLAIMQDPNATLTIHRSEREWTLSMTINEKEIAKMRFHNTSIYLRADVDAASDMVRFYYSMDNKTFHLFGAEFKMHFNLTVFCGNRFGIFNYATLNNGGHVDIDWFRVENIADNTIIGQPIEAEQFDYIRKADVRMCRPTASLRNQEVTFKEYGGNITFKKINLGEYGAQWFEATLCSNAQNAFIEIRDGNREGQLINRFGLPDTKGDLIKVCWKMDKAIFGQKEITISVIKGRYEEVALDSFRFF